MTPPQTASALSDATGMPFSITADQKNQQLEWVQFGYDAGHSGFNPLEHAIDVKNVSSLKVKWTSQSLSQYGGLIADGKDIFAEVINEPTGGLYAVDAATGKQKWRANLGLTSGWYVNATPVVANGIITSPCSNGSSSHFLVGYCGVNEANGKTLWTDFCSGTFNGFACSQYPDFTGPTLYDGTVYVQIGSGGDQPDTVAIDPANGKVAWDVPGVVDCPDAGGPATGPPAADGLVFAVLGCGGTSSKVTEICALSASSGHAQWCEPTLNAYTEALIEADGLVLMVEPNQNSNTENGVVALNPKTGARLWTALLPGSNYSALAAANGRVFVEDGRYGVYALSAKNGNILWSYTQGSLNAFPAGVISVANGLVYTSGGPGNNGNSTVAAFNEETGALVWNDYTDCGTGALAPAVVVNAAIYAGQYLCKFALPAPRK